MASLSLETHSPALFIAHTTCALVGVGLMTFTSFEAKGEIRRQAIRLPVKLSRIIFKFFEKSSLPLGEIKGVRLCPKRAHISFN
jgi:hypothetical protein